jgi:membrane protein implicated in regulation of membrane protease activity
VVYAYTAAAVVGVVLLAASLFGAGHDHAVGHSANGGHESPAFALLSARVWTYLLTFGGATGLLLHFVTPVREPLRAAIALGVGMAAAVLARGVISRASRGGASGTAKQADFVGSTGRVLVPFQTGSTGKVRCSAAVWRSSFSRSGATAPPS